MRINTNVASLQAQEAAKNTARNQSSSLEKLGTGLAINKASDDGAGLAIADKLRTQASSINQSLSNANSASALVNIADKAMSEQSNILDTVKSKLIQASTATTTDDGREAIRKDITKLLEQFDNIASQTNYNGTTLLQADKGTTTAAQANNNGFSFQMGEDKTYDINLTLTRAVNTRNLGGGDDEITTAASLDIDSGDSQRLVGTAATMTIGETTTAVNTDITLSGNLGTAVTFGDSQSTLDLSNETIETIEKMKILADNHSVLTYNTATDEVTFSSATSLDLSEIEFTSLDVEMASAKTMTVVNSDGFTVKNNLSGSSTIDVSVGAGETAQQGNLLSSIKALQADELTATKANDFMATIDESLTQLNEVRTDFGSAQNQIESSIRNLETTFTNIKAAESVIRDVDYAKESASFNKQNIIAQAGTYAMSQANAMQQNVSRLLQ